ncbi:MAG TPA: MFS transporter [Acetobacteraceae bacterium]|nr:MFS transporter [Acetobacteraceae bacterium]
MQITALVAAALFMENLDSTVIVTALPQMARSFGTDPVGLNIGVTVYTLTLAVLIPISGWMADRFGARRVFAAAIATFTAASVLCGFSQGQWSFIACRVLQGSGGAMMVPVGRLVMIRAAEKRDLVRLISYVALSSLLAPVVGPPVGGAVTTYLGWPWLFFLNVPLGLIGIWFALALISDERAACVPRFDLSGFLLCGGGAVCLTYGLELMGRRLTPWAAATVFIAAGLLLGALALRHLRRAEQPLLPLAALRIPTYGMTLRGGALFRISVTMVPFLLTTMFQLGFGLGPFASGLLTVPLFVGGVGMKIVTTRTLRRYGFRRVLLLNGALTALTILGCAALTPSTPYAVIAIVLFATGLTRSMQFSALNSLAFADVSREQTSGTNTLANVVQQLTLGFGIAAAAASVHLAALLHREAGTGPTLMDFRAALVAAAVMTAVSTLDALALSRDAGSLVSGHRPARSAHGSDLAHPNA